MILLLLATLLLVSLSLTGSLYRRVLFNPLVVFFSVWFISFFLYELDDIFHVFYVGLSWKAEFLFVGSFVSFFVGAVSFSFYRMGIGSKDRPASLGIEPFHVRSIYKITKIVLPLFLVGVAWKYALLIERFGNPLSNLSTIREATVSGAFTFPFLAEVLTVLSYLVIVNLGVLLVFHPKRKLVLFLTVVTMIAAYLRDTTIGGRGSTMINGLLLVCTVFSAAIAKGVQFRLRHYLGGIAALFGVILLITTILFLRSDGSRSYLDRLTKDSYLYIVGSIPSFSEFINDPLPSNYPLYQTMGGLYKLADMASQKTIGVSILGAEDLQTRYAAITLGPFNSSGHLAYYYADGGEIGVVAGSFLLGLIGAYLFFKAATWRRLLDVQLFALIMVYLAFSIRGVLSAGPLFWTVIVFVLVQHGMFQFSLQSHSPKGIEPLALPR